MSGLGDLIYTPEKASDDAFSKVESHTPKIEAPDTVEAGKSFEVKIAVGPHPNTVEHSIRKIEVYFQEKGRAFNPILVASTELAPVYSEPKLTLTLKVSRGGVPHVIEYCNLHGLWEAKKEIGVRGSL